MDQDEKSGQEALNSPELAARFARLREAESLAAPAVPRVVTAEARYRNKLWNSPMLPRAAAAAAVVAVSLTLLWQPSDEDPAHLYLSILDQQSWPTDALLEVSDALLPALAAEPEFYQIDLDFDVENYPN